MVTKKTLTFFIFMLLAGSINAKTPLENILYKGSSWVLAVDNNQQTMIIEEVQLFKTKTGNTSLHCQVSWAGSTGKLTSFSRRNSQKQSLSLTLSSGNTSQIVCRGLISKGNNNFMAGTCDSGGAWYAVRDKHVSLQEKRRKTQKKSSNLSEKKSFASFKNKVDGDYYKNGNRPMPGGRAVNVMSPIFPEIPQSQSKISSWLASHNISLLNTINGILSQTDKTQLRRMEQEKCEHNNIFCQIGIRQQVISCALGVKCP